MNSLTTHLIRCLQQIYKVIWEANEILAGISQPSVCREVLLSAPGTAYIWGLSEIYQISRRLAEAMNARKLASELLLQKFREVDLAWNNLLSFLVFGRSAFQLLLLPLVPVNEPCLTLANGEPNQVCGVCLTAVKQEPQVQSGNLHPIVYQGFFYHISCANFWLNCVDATLPRET
ncbi:synergin gamma-like [Protobothrops mucrosquamatus]|uniref:synergin gamma-like n=1 Tax=Protobothrops mucrosquamatus TaxID=103944 RepID=UPI000775C77B|nr:synergin gamma-like [Protobothrops mucrosquamatus]